MNFYKSIASYYEYIFLFNLRQADFLCEEKINIGKFLDLGCATGSLCIEMKKRLFNCTGLDLDEEFIKICQKKDNEINFLCENMLNVGKLFDNNQFDLISCFGNTLSHITKNEYIQKFFNDIFNILKNKSVFSCQILNYDRILKQNINTLPLIDNENVKFKRKYKIREDGLLDFNTELLIKELLIKELLSKESEEIIKNSVILNPIKYEDIKKMLINAGFTNIKFYEDFNKNPFNIETSYPLIFVAQK
ncbi:MAG: class I SAM-dependent methyltransferase [Candidatus Muirbacterium halophilum]|nr:class I SAM-dependent methyltransferase [Candidatus Muirbacterium halophilum]MCK9474894.1 class I SAM-dependent methyltransferase [Candidatus Muirbacterium halophilum]